MKLKKVLTSLTFWIFASMFIGIFVGYIMGDKASMFKPLGDLFMQLIKMLVVPLVFISIISGAATLGASKNAGRIGFSTLAYIFITTVMAIVIAIFAGVIAQPGAGIPMEVVQNFTAYEASSGEVAQSGFWETIIEMIPANPIKALAEGNILQIIVFGLFLGFGISSLSEKKKAPVLNAFNSLLDGLIWCITKVMWVAPIGVFGLMADATGTFGFDLLLNVANLLWLNVVLVLFMLLIFYPVTIKLFSKLPIKTFFKAMTKPQIVAFSTSSSMATLPVNLETVENELHVSKETASFVVPLGATINMTGNAIYYTLVALFFAQFYQIDLHLSHYIAITLTASLGSIGQAGVPGPTLMVVAVLASAGIPLEGLPLFYALDRVFDMIRTVVNITGDAACAVIVDNLNKH